jgi:cystathionine gamma-synthase
MDRSTLAIHAGRGPRTPGGALNPPLVLASSFHGGDYAREQGAPTWEAFEEALGALESGRSVAFASGTAAAAAILLVLLARRLPPKPTDGS